MPFKAGVQYGDFKGTAAADRADKNELSDYLRSNGLMQAGEFLIAVELWVGENHGGKVAQLAALDDVDEILRAHRLVTGGAPGAPPIANGSRVGASLLRAATTMISAALQTEVESVFKEALPLTFDHFNAAERVRYWEDCKKSWGNPNPHNIRTLFFRLGFSDALDGLRWQKCANANVVSTLDAINQVRNRIAHGQPLTVNGHPFRLTRPIVGRWRAFAQVFTVRFRPFIIGQYEG